MRYLKTYFKDFCNSLLLIYTYIRKSVFSWVPFTYCMMPVGGRGSLDLLLSITEKTEEGGKVYKVLFRNAREFSGQPFSAMNKRFFN